MYGISSYGGSVIASQMNAVGFLSALRLLSPSPELGVSKLNGWNVLLDIPSIPLLAERV